MENLDDHGVFETSVRVVLKSKELEIFTTRQAAELLLYSWPTGETGYLSQARMACMRVLGGNEKAETARKAFEDAAAEADILVEEQAI
ncbi:DUF982 domain-containing protein [Pseudaminobacter arsenicus]|uniref:DUF982 domain-containing protein n=1 Tax=Borborobacter arsenicus TaxID=1851146 RepID=A0A432UZ36_9HYPH|nr:DUF982 domain-containing protein [Pseudaminobacter arsenicus]RUM95165.1 DUF982 domain-containing protein [Pseudaminobacter arsenicus]